ncbi:hypothetical protein, partial [Salipiger abyssi]|uniref:hypothetical protein n=1 Tax=Salipiger abyssi TaxID=1250539 RepID=UPI001A8E19B0
MNDLFGDFDVEHAALSSAFEPNDTADTAAELTEGSHQVTGSVIDWYRLDVLSGEIAIDMTPLTEYGGRPQNMNMSLYRDPDGSALVSDIQSGDTPESIRFLAGEEGSYYLKVYWAQFADGDHPDGVTFGYQLDVDLPEAVPSDGNDTLETAAPIPEGTTTHSGTVMDWYRIDTVSGEMNFSMTPLQQGDGSYQNLNMTLYDADGNVLRGANGSNGGAEMLSHLAGSEGTYYLRVFWARYPDGAPNGITLDYELTVDLPEEQVSDGNDTQATAELLAEGTTTHSGTDVDWYRFDSLSGEINVTMNTLPQANGEMQNL